MARRRHRSRRGRSLLLPLAVLLVLVLGAAFGWRWYEQRFEGVARYKIAPVNLAADRIDPAYEGRHVRLRGLLTFAQGGRDAQLGVSGKGAVLFRDVQMLQWQEQCANGDCTYTTVWSAEPIDSSRFRNGAGHANPPLPFVSKWFAASDLRLGAFAVDADLVAAQGRTQPHAASAADLPPNLAAVFRVVDGVLYAGGDPAAPQVGTVKISYRLVPAADVELMGVQRGSQLRAD
jgi:hypothetical protein